MRPDQANRLLRDTVQLLQSGQYVRAREMGMKLLNAFPRQPQVLSILGSVHGQLGEFGDAEKCYRLLASIEPLAHSHPYFLGLTLVMQKRLAEAVPVFTRVLQLRPDFAEGHMQMGCLLRDLGQHESAIGYFRRALELSPTLVDAAVFLGNMLVFQGKLDEALDCYNRALKHHPGFPDAVAGKTMILERRGDKQAAWENLQEAVSQGHISPNVAITYALLAPKFGQGEKAKEMLKGLLSGLALAPTQQQELHFALGNLYDKCGEYDLAFAQYCSANQLAQITFDVKGLKDKVERIKRGFAGVDAKKAPLPPVDAPAPIFIVGMPRSGTSLIEQILASHPDVAAGGELELLPELELGINSLLGNTVPYPECVGMVDTDELERLSGRYREVISTIAEGAKFVTDKLPPNYERLGLIQQLFPDARIIHVMREPRDTCLSCYFQNFGNTHTYSTNLRLLGEVYGIYNDLMNYWNETLSIPMLEVSYEAVVADAETSVREILKFCGLAWHADCLDFYSADRYINTASYDQVRQPLYASSVNRWRHYAGHLHDLDKVLLDQGL